MRNSKKRKNSVLRDIVYVLPIVIVMQASYLRLYGYTRCGNNVIRPVLFQ